MKTVHGLIFLISIASMGQWNPLANDMDGIAVNDQAGSAVAINAAGNIIAVGSPVNDLNGTGSGQVRVFENSGGNWVQVGADINGSAANDHSGFSVSINNEGNLVAIGAPDKTSNGFESGQVRVFENLSGNWTQVGDEIIGEAFSDHSGFSLSLSGDGSTLAIGAPDNEGTLGGNYGHVRVFENQGGNWVQVGADIDGEAAEDNSGYAVDLSNNGSVVAIGAPFNDDSDSDSGHVRVYRNETGSWVQIGNDIDGETANDRFGSALEISADGNIVAIGGYDHNSTGHVRVFENQGGNWVQLGNTIDGGANNERFAFSVALNADGSIVAIGAPLSDEGGLEKGRVEVYQYQLGTWTKIDDNITGESNEDRSGDAVCISANGTIVGIGAYLNDDGGNNAGHARVYSNSSILSNEQGYFQDAIKVAPNPIATRVELCFEQIKESVNVSVYDNQGRQVMSQRFTQTSNVNIDMGHLAKGVYTLQSTDTRNRKAVIKFIKE